MFVLVHRRGVLCERLCEWRGADHAAYADVVSKSEQIASSGIGHQALPQALYFGQ